MAKDKKIAQKEVVFFTNFFCLPMEQSYECGVFRRGCENDNLAKVI